MEQTMNPGDPDVSNRFHRVTHHLGGDARFFENRKIACPGADDGDCALAVHRTIAPNTHCPGFGKVLWSEGGCSILPKARARSVPPGLPSCPSQKSLQACRGGEPGGGLPLQIL